MMQKSVQYCGALLGVAALVFVLELAWSEGRPASNHSHESHGQDFKSLSDSMTKLDDSVQRLTTLVKNNAQRIEKLREEIGAVLPTTTLTTTLNTPAPSQQVTYTKLESTEKWRVIENKANDLIAQIQKQYLTMLSKNRLVANFELVRLVLQTGLPGDIVETGTWKGGSALLMASILKWAEEEFNVDTGRHVWLCDSFEGLPAPTALDKAVEGKVSKRMDAPGSYAFGADGVKQVQKTFADHGFGAGRWLERVHFVKGWFSNTMPTLHKQIGPIAVLRLDGDMYSSTMDVLMNVYSHVCAGCVIIIDDYGYWPQCKLAVHDFFEPKGVDLASVIHVIDDTGIWFLRPADKK